MPRFLAIALAVSALLVAVSYALTSQGYRIDLGSDEPSEVQTARRLGIGLTA